MIGSLVDTVAEFSSKETVLTEGDQGALFVENARVCALSRTLGGVPAVRALWQSWRMGLFTVAEARAELDRLRPVLDELVALRADAAELAAALTVGGPRSSLGGLPELKAAQARLDELMTTVQQTGAELKGFAPLLVDFPADLDGVAVLLCWLEGDQELGWYHRTELGFAGRRPLP
jgi:hypothetical protein